MKYRDSLIKIISHQHHDSEEIEKERVSHVELHMHTGNCVSLDQGLGEAWAVGNNFAIPYKIHFSTGKKSFYLFYKVTKL